MAVQEAMVVETQEQVHQLGRATGVAVVGLPPLEPGDRLTRHEFERRYNAMPHLKK